MPYEKHYSHFQKGECTLYTFQIDRKDNKLPLMWDEDRAGYIEGFRFGDQVGLWNEYYESGQLKTRESFWEGKLTGISEAFKEDGELIARVCYEAGEVVAISVCN